VKGVGLAKVAATAAVLLSLAACSGSSPSEQPSRSTQQPTSTTPAASSSAPGGPTPLDGAADPLPAGRYTKPGFTPAISFRVGSGWHAVQEATGFFDVERDPGALDVIAVQFARPSDPQTAREAVASIRGRRGLVVRSTDTHRIGAASAIRIVIDNADPDLQAQHFTAALTLEAGPLSLASGRRLQIDLIDTSDGLLAILVGGSVRRWAATERVAEPVVRSVRLLSD
jgi:hypothetical protein